MSLLLPGEDVALWNLSFKLSVKYNLVTLRINYVTALTKTRELSSECEIGVCPSERGPPPHNLGMEGDRDGAFHGQGTSHLGPLGAGVLEECQGVGLRGGEETVTRRYPPARAGPAPG